MMTEEQTHNYIMAELARRLHSNGISDVEITPANIKPSKHSSLPLDKQEKLIEAVKQHPNDSWAFFGDPGTGKTTLSNLLFKLATFQDIVAEGGSGSHHVPHIWRVTARELCQQAQDRATGRDLVDEDYIVDTQAMMKASARLANRERIQRAMNADLRPRLFVEEWDKISASPFQLLHLHDVLDAVTSSRGQLVMTCNLTWDQFCERFGTTNWRIKQNCHVAQMFDKVVINPPTRELSAFSLD